MARIKHHFDEAAADRVVTFFECGLTHVKGDLAGQPLLLDGWQKDMLREVFGWKRADGTRSYRTVYIEIPRKNGKSTICAGIALYGLLADNEAGAEVYCAASDRAQAGITFKIAKQMRAQSAMLSERSRAYHNSIMVPSDGSFLQSISADAYRQHGFNSHMVIFDELHTQRTRDLYDTLDTSFASRSNPLFVMITTAGYDRTSICWEVHQYARDIIAGRITDDSFFALIYSAEDEDGEKHEDADFWKKQATWKRANPSYGRAVKKDYLAERAKRAETSAAYTNTFKRLHLNIWTTSESRWITDAVWATGNGTVNPDKCEGDCYCGLDLATHNDLAALAVYFPKMMPKQVYWLFWVPEANVDDRDDLLNLRPWVDMGLIQTTEGNGVDFDFIKQAIIDVAEKHDVKEVAYDRWGATQLAMQLTGEGVTMVPFGQGYASMSSPSKELHRLLLAEELNHGSNPVLSWMAANVMVTTDAAGNIKPDKGKSRNKIDGIVALIEAIGRADVNALEEDRDSVYEEEGRGLLVL